LLRIPVPFLQLNLMSNTLQSPAFHVVGIYVRTTNQNGQSQKDIGKLWQHFFEQGIIDQIQYKDGFDIYCIYTDYESDQNGAYTTILGCKVSSFGNIPPACIGKTIPAGSYEVHTSQGKLPQCVLDTWTQIWQSSSPRAYLADFDVYGVKAQNPDNAVVDTYVSVK
jgi:predicted transcriptional regulator YdeE